MSLGFRLYESLLVPGFVVKGTKITEENFSEIVREIRIPILHSEEIDDWVVWTDLFYSVIFEEKFFHRFKEKK